MKNLDLRIADYKIRLEAADSVLTPDKRFSNFICRHDRMEGVLRIPVYSGPASIPAGAEKVYNADFSTAEITAPVNNPDFWSVWKQDDTLYLAISFPSNPSVKAVLKFRLDLYGWELRRDSDSDSYDALEYPLDSLVLYYLTVINSDIMIHASGVGYNGKGYLFSGVSGRGKTTMARLWDKKEGKVIHDDRLIIRKQGYKYVMHNTPVYKDDEPRSTALDRIYILEHGTENIVTPVRGAEAVSLVMANCIQHNWGENIIRGHLESITDLCRNVPVYKLSFRPEESVIDHILKDE